MTFTIGLLSVFALLHLPSLLGYRWRYLESTRDKARVAFAFMFFISGTTHFTDTASFALMIPPSLPDPVVLVYLSGLLEILGAIGLLIPVPWLQRLVAYGIVLLLLTVFPANIYAAIAGIVSPGAPSSPLYLWLRLPLQAFYIAWVLWSVGPIRYNPREEAQGSPDHEKIIDQTA